MRRALLLPLVCLVCLVCLVGLAFLHCNDDPADAPTPGVDAGSDAPRARDPNSGDAGEDAPTEGKGSRFNPVYAVRAYEDGTTERLFESLFWDTRDRRLCHIRELTEGVYGCVPELGWAEEVFSDSACTTPVNKIITSSSSGYASIGGGSCSPKIVPIYQPRRAPTYQKTDRGCVRGNDSDVFSVADPVPYSTLGVFTASKADPLPRDRNGTRLVVESIRLTGDDGSFEVRPSRIVDRELQSTGRVLFASDGKLRFLPAAKHMGNPPYPGYFADPTCTTSIVSFNRETDDCHADPYASKGGFLPVPLGSTCNGYRAMMPPSQPPLPKYYSSESATCQERSVPSWLHVYPAGTPTEIPAPSLVEITRTLVPTKRRAEGGSALEERSIVYTSADGFAMQEREPRLYLRKYDLPCAVDIVGRCVPESPIDNARGNYFSDDACTQPVLQLFNTSLCSGPASPFYRSSDRVYRLPPTKLALTTVYLKEGAGSCRAMAASDYTYYAAPSTPEEVPASEFPAMTSMEPDFGE